MKLDKKQGKPWVQSLTEAFNEKSVGHISIDLQDSYCDPEHPRIKKNGLEETARRGEAVAHAVGAFVSAHRKYLTNIWVAHNCASIYGVPPMQADMYLEKLARESFHVSLPVNDNDLVICKKNFSAFDGTELDGALKRQNIKTLFLSGVFLDACVYDTARDAMKLGYNVYVLKGMVASSGVSQESDKHNLKKIQNEAYAGVISPRLVSKIATGKFSPS